MNIIIHISIILIFYRVYYPHIIGTNGMTRKKLENETKTTIDVPKKGKDGNIGKKIIIITSLCVT